MRKRVLRWLGRALAVALLISTPVQAFDQTTYELQVLLTELGYEPGPVDGLSGQRTRDALERFATEHQLIGDTDPAEILQQLRQLASGGVSQTTGLAIEIMPQIGLSTTIAVSPDGRLIAASDHGGQIAIADLATGRVLRTLVGHGEGVADIAFSSDGSTLASASRDDTARLWDVASGRLLHILPLPDDGRSVAFSPQGSELATAGLFSEVQFWSVRTGERLRVLKPKQGLSNLFFMDGGRQLLATTFSSIEIWDLSRERVLLKIGPDLDMDSYISHGDLSPDGRFFAASVGKEDVVVWDLASGRENTRFSADDYTPLVFLPNGQSILSRVDGKLQVRSAQTGQFIRELPGSGAGMARTPQGQLVLAGKTMRVVDPETGNTMSEIDSKTVGQGLGSFAADSSTIEIVSHEGLRSLDVRTGQMGPLSAFDRKGSHFTTAADTTVFYSEGKVLFWDNPTHSLRATAEFDAAALDVSPDGRIVAVTSADWKSVSLIDATSAALLHRIDLADHVHGVSFSPDGELVALTTFHETVLARSATGQVLHRSGKGGDVPTFSPEGRLLVTRRLAATSSEDGDLLIWETATGQLMRTIEAGNDEITAFAFSPDGQELASLGNSGLIRIRHATTGQLLRTLPNRFGGGRGQLAYSADGRTLAAALTWSGQVQLWDPKQGELLAQSFAFKDGEWVTLTPEGFFTGSESGARHLAVVRGLQSYSIDQLFEALYRPDLVAAKLAGDPDLLFSDAAGQIDLEVVLDTGAAPGIDIANLEDGVIVDTDRIEVSALVTDRGGGIGRVEWRVNGVTLGLDSRGFDRLSSHAGQIGPVPIEITQLLTLDPGTNLIEAVAYNREGLISSAPSRVTVTWDGQSASEPPTLHVLAVGVDEYHDSRLRLNFAASDATAVGEAFRRAGEGLYQKVEVTTLLDAAVTSSGLAEAFEALSARVRTRDVFVLFMAGHGKTQDGQYYFLPQDFRYVDETSVAEHGIGQHQFQAWLSIIPARKSLLLYDTCESGSLTNGMASRGLEEVAALARLTRAMGRTVMSASTDSAPALEGYRGHGVFTYALLQALNEGDSNSDGTIAVTELAGSVDIAVPELSYAAFNFRQIPQMSIVGSDFPVAQRADILGALAAPDLERPPPSQHTHVIIAPAELFAGPEAGSEPNSVLPVGTLVSAMQSSGSFFAVFKDGKALGYVDGSTLALVN
ncbi:MULTISPECIES: caspase family protein [Devosia]|uniref:caspase family protein n=1 Tax=Devosia TaxID=46913 RepID=UPI000CE954EB|nr:MULTISPECIES: caspase family protein [Devosia]AVF02937.1 hypothetical protein C4375_03755 [Devosia sp. I507]